MYIFPIKKIHYSIQLITVIFINKKIEEQHHSVNLDIYSEDEKYTNSFCISLKMVNSHLILMIVRYTLTKYPN